MVFVIASEKKWHYPLFEKLKQEFGQHIWHMLNSRELLNIDFLNSIKPDKIFFPHWSFIIPREIYETYECIVFHMTDLPYGRGGSPLQNLIIRGHTHTKISALRVEKGIDTGPIYLKKDLVLTGSAEEIFLRSSNITLDMIIEIVNDNPQPTEQKGEIVLFKRRRPEESSVENISDIHQLYDQIRMLDADGYPKAFIQTVDFLFEFYGATLADDKTLITNVRITKK